MKKAYNIKVSMLILILTLQSLLVACSGETSSSYGDTEINEDLSSIDGETVEFNNISDKTFSMSNIAYDTKEQYTEDSIEYSNDSEETVNNEVIEDVTYDKTSNTISDNNDTNIVLVEDKLVYRCNMNVETLNYDESYATLNELMKKYNCVISSEIFEDRATSYMYNGYKSSNDNYKSGRTNTIVIRVPSANYNNFVNEYGKVGNIISKTQTVDNITQQYHDTTSQVEGLKAQMQRLETMLAQATEIEDMITINESITELQTEINSLTTEIISMDNDVAYSYITMQITEVVEYSDVEQPIKRNTFIDRLKNQCKDTWKGFLNFLENSLFTIISLLPALVIIGIIYLIVRLTCKKKITAWKESRKLRKINSMNELIALLNYDETKVDSGVKTDEQRDKQEC